MRGSLPEAGRGEAAGRVLSLVVSAKTVGWAGMYALNLPVHQLMLLAEKESVTSSLLAKSFGRKEH
jgi:hypothetical protein